MKVELIIIEIELHIINNLHFKLCKPVFAHFFTEKLFGSETEIE